jgi:hypothetical protein
MGRPRGWAAAATGRPPMRSPVARREDRQRFWAAVSCGLSSEDAGVAAGEGQALLPGQPHQFRAASASAETSGFLCVTPSSVAVTGAPSPARPARPGVIRPETPLARQTRLLVELARHRDFFPGEGGVHETRDGSGASAEPFLPRHPVLSGIAFRAGWANFGRRLGRSRSCAPSRTVRVCRKQQGGYKLPSITSVMVTRSDR